MTSRVPRISAAPCGAGYLRHVYDGGTVCVRCGTRRPQRPYTEERAIDRLQDLAARWPRSLTLFSNSGTLEVLHSDDYAADPVKAEDIATIIGIPNDGGDRT